MPSTTSAPGASKLAAVADPWGSPLAAELRDDVLERFVRYARIDTQSARESDTYPSTGKQLELSRLLAEELRGLGLDEVEITEHGIRVRDAPGRRGSPAG